MSSNKRMYAVVSGEGDGPGHVERHYVTETGIKRILTRERCDGDRWARATEIQEGESLRDAAARSLHDHLSY